MEVKVSSSNGNYPPSISIVMVFIVNDDYVVQLIDQYASFDDSID